MWVNIILLQCIVISTVITVYLAMKKPSENQKWMLLTVICASISQLLYYYQTHFVTLDAMESFYNLGFVTRFLAVDCFWLLISSYCNMPVKKRAIQIAFVGTIIMASLLMSNKFHHLVYTPIGIGYDFAVPYMIMDVGILWAALSLGMVAIMLAGIWKIYRKMKVSGDEERVRLFILMIAVLIPMLGFIVKRYVMNDRLDTVIVGFIVSSMIFFLLVRKYGMLDTVQIAREAIVENTQEGLIVVDTDYNVLYTNPVAKKFYPKIDELNTLKEKEKLKEFFLHPEGVYNEQNTYWEVRVSSLYEEKKLRGYMAWIFDMSFINEYTNEILHLKDEAEKANHAKSLFLANMSHEIRTPMNAILGFSELILQEKNNPVLTQEYASDIKRSAKNLLHIINEVLDFSKIEAGKAEIIEENYYIQSLLEDVSLIAAHQAAEKKLTYIPRIDKTLPCQLKGSAKSIHEILTNILNNAVKYTRYGKVALDVSCKERKGNIVQLQFVVNDTGIGMKKEDVEKIFEKFSQFDTTTNRNVEGTGLGMSIVKALVEQMCGEIHIDSEYGMGTKITILLEQEVVDARPIGEVHLGMEELEKKGRRQEFTTTAKILVVDDNETNLKVTTGLLKRYGVQADTADSGFAAIEQIANQEYDIVFLDHMMPEMDGVETMYKIREMEDGKYKDLTIIALTANAISGVKEQMIAHGFTGYLSKPIDVEKLERSIIKNLPKEMITYHTNEAQNDVNPSQVETVPEIETNVFQHIDASIGVRNCGGTAKDYYLILEVVIKYGRKRIEKLRRLIEEHDFENYTIDVHALKSTAANIGAMELSQMAFEQEMAGKEKNFNLILEKYEPLLKLYEAVLDEVEAILQKKESTKEVCAKEADKAAQKEMTANTKTQNLAETEKFPITEEELAKLLQNVSSLLEDFELERAEEILKETDLFLLEDSVTNKINEAIQKLQDCDVDGAVECIQSI